MKKHTLTIDIFDFFVEEAMPQIQEILDYKGEEANEENITSLLEFLLKLGCNHHIKNGINRYIAEIRSDKAQKSNE